jgi:hypothetical protein
MHKAGNDAKGEDPSLAPPSRASVRAVQQSLRLQGAAADPLAVVQAHIDAVHTGDPALMAADYAEEARIRRGAAIEVPAHYFPQAVRRLGHSRLLVHSLQRVWPEPPFTARGAVVSMQWELLGGGAHGTRGTDTFTVVGDRIVDQQVQLHTPDY